MCHRVRAGEERRVAEQYRGIGMQRVMDCRKAAKSTAMTLRIRTQNEREQAWTEDCTKK